MAGAHQKLNNSRDLTAPSSRMFAIRGLALATINLSINLKSISTHYEDMKRDTKWGRLEWLRVTQGHWK